MDVLGIIPARFESSRFPGKPLIDLAGMTMIERVYRQCQRCRSLDEIIVATDDQRILDVVESFGGKAAMTGLSHSSGTDRVAEVASAYSEECLVINIQGDEPLIDPRQIEQVVTLLKKPEVAIATLARWIDLDSEIIDPNVVKVVTGANDKAIYFSRCPIPFNRNSLDVSYKQHIGIYGFQNKVLQKLTALEAGGLEIIESLEQLRWLENGFDIYLAMSDFPTYAVDTPADVEHILAELNK